MRPLVTPVLLALLLAAPARADEPAAPAASAADGADAEVIARLDFLIERLDDGRAHADHWARGWEAFYAIATVTSAGWAVTRDVPVQRTDALVGAAKSALGGATHLTMITFSAERGAADVRALPRDTPEARRHALAVAEAALRTNARDAGQRTFWLRHLGTVLVNVAGGLIVGLAHHDWKTAGISTAVGIGTGEAAIWSQPWRAPSDWRDYEARFGPGSN